MLLRAGRHAFLGFFWDLVARLRLVEGLFGEHAVEGGDSAGLLDGFEALNLGFVLVDDHHGVDAVELVQVANAAFDQFDQDQGLDDGVAGGADGDAVEGAAVEDAESVAEVLGDLAAGCDSDLVFGGVLLLLLNFLVVLHLMYKECWCECDL